MLTITGNVTDGDNNSSDVAPRYRINLTHFR